MNNKLKNEVVDMKKWLLLVVIIASLPIKSLFGAEKIIVDVNFDVKHVLGAVSAFDRKKFVAIHADITEREWDGDNFTTDLRNDFLNGYDVYLGRNTGGITWYLNAQVGEDASRAGFADTLDIFNLGKNVKNTYASNTIFHTYESRNDQIICAQLHPFWPDGQLTQKGWALSQNDTQQEPLGTATGEYMGRYIRDFYGAGGLTGQVKPHYVEVINEPLWHLVDYGNETPEKVFRFHNAVASEIRKYNPDVAIGGYCTAFPNHETNDFAEWKDRWKLFMDLAGSNMDFWTIHLYDFPSINNGKQLYRKGSNMEATFDLMEQYSFMKFGVVKPFVISEFGAQMHDYFGAWSPYRDWLHIKSVNAMMMQFMERANIIDKAIDFLIVKAEWGTSGVNDTYNHRLLRKENEPVSYTGKWVYTDMVKIYQLWSDVKGTRIDTYSTDLDVMTDAYVDGKEAYLILDNLKFEPVTIDLKTYGLSGNNIQEVNIKHLYLEGNAPVLKEQKATEAPASIVLQGEGTMIIHYTLAQNANITETSQEKKYYASTNMSPITAGVSSVFSIDNVEKGLYGEAVLRLGIGRDHGKSLLPEVIVNGTAIKLSDKNYRGDDQHDRNSFFGVLEIKVPYELIKTGNEIKVTFSDDGGYISSVSMREYTFSKEIKRSENVITGLSNQHFYKNVIVYPNPTNDKAYLVVTQDMIGKSWTCYSAVGHLMRSGKINASKTMVDTAGWPKGVYCLRIGDNLMSRKMVVN